MEHQSCSPATAETPAKIPTPHSNFNLAEIFGQPVEKVDTIIQNLPSHVRQIEIPQKNGTVRSVLAPDGTLKYIQKAIYWRIFRRYHAIENVHGFIGNRGVITNARNHVGAKSLGTIVIKSLCDSISEKHLKIFLFGNKNICRYCRYYEYMLEGKCHPSLSCNKNKNYPHTCEEIKAVHVFDYCDKTGYQSLLTRIIGLCIYNGYTAQGFPTTPIMANIVLRDFDKTMAAFCANYGITYTRYADELCFSSRFHNKWQLRELIQKKAYRLLGENGFIPNKNKTNWKSHFGRLKVCGIVVNEKLSIQKSVVNKFRAEVFNATSPLKNAARTTMADIRRMKGFASYLMSVDRKKGEKYMNILKAFEEQKFGRVPAE